MRRRGVLAGAAALMLAACTGRGTEDGATVGPAPEGDSGGREPGGGSSDGGGSGGPGGPGDGATREFTVTEHGTLQEGSAMCFLPGTDHLLITERGGTLRLRDQRSGEVSEVGGTPQVRAAGQGGLHDVIPGPTFEDDGVIYLSWVREHAEGSHGVVGRGVLEIGDQAGQGRAGDDQEDDDQASSATLRDLEVLWEQSPADGDGHFSLRLLVQGEHLFVTSGDRQAFTPAQERDTNLGAVLRLTLDGDPAPGNPWESEGGVAAQLWTMGHRNPLGIAEDRDGNVWVSEMGPRGGDELNLLEAGANYGWPEASMGRHYDGSDIPDHTEGDGFVAPAVHWVPSISPGSLLIYRGELFTLWQGSALLGGLTGQNLVRVALDGATAEQADRWDMGERMRALAEAPDGAVWLLEDGSDGRLLELRPV